jgi:hypothetical protein
MIVITTECLDKSFHILPGDSVRLSVKGECVVEEVFAHKCFVDYMAGFRFALDDGTCVGDHVCGIFADKSRLPEEVRSAKRIQDLTTEQYRNFMRTVGTRLA